MRVQFDSTLDELVVAHRRYDFHMKVVRSWRWIGSLATALVGGIVVFALLPESFAV